MKKLTLFGILGLALVLGLSACNLPTSPASESLSLEEQAGTLVAQTIEANKTRRPTKTRVPAYTPTKSPPTKTGIPTETGTPTDTPTPTESPSLPTAPSLKNYDFFCSWNGSNNDLSITIKWTDKANNELGYLIYRNGEEIANLLPNAITYTDTFAVNTGQQVNYAIEAYNNAGLSGAFTVSATCQ